MGLVQGQPEGTKEGLWGEGLEVETVVGGTQFWAASKNQALLGHLCPVGTEIANPIPDKTLGNGDVDMEVLPRRSSQCFSACS